MRFVALFNVCFDNYVEGMQLLLRIFFGCDDLVVKHVVAQQSADNLYGRGVRFDVLAEDSEGKLYDCEVQRANEGAIPRRARYNSSMMDSRELAKGADFSKLPETWVIFITENDIYGEGFPLYHVEQKKNYTVPKDVDTQKEGMALSIRSMMEKLNFSMEKAMDILQIPAAERAKYAALVKG